MIAMTIAGFDPSGGAGVLNDIKTFHALGLYGTAVITALTAQNVACVSGVEGVSTVFIEKQIETLLEKYPIKYAKTGMLFSNEIVKCVAEKIVEHNINLVVDPVMIAGCGDLLQVDDISDTLINYLLPNAALVTPNIFEAEKLSGMTINNIDDAADAAIKIGKKCDVLITGGHLNGLNVFYNGSVSVFEEELVKSDNTHGTGCSYSAAVTANLAKGYDKLQSIKLASEFVKNSVIHGEWGTLNQFYNDKID